jgi:DNA-binding MarR family transcriptional regulator
VTASSSPDSPERGALVDKLTTVLREQIANTVLYTHQIAERLGRNATDLQCLHLLVLHGPCTAGRLAQLTHLTTGAITAVVDRLEGAGYVRRERDLRDRRKVVVAPVLERVERDILPLYDDAAKATNQLLDRYSDQELATIVDFLERLAAGYHAAEWARPHPDDPEDRPDRR